MIRKQVAGKKKESRDHIKWRGHEVTRIEAFSDAVFAFAVTLLIVSLEVPKTAAELFEMMRSFLPFALCFTLLFQIWYAQNIFFRRFALHDIWTMVLNGTLLFMTLFFVYPLKFLSNAVFFPKEVIMTAREAQKLFYIYSGGFSAIYMVFALLYYNAMRRKHILELNTAEAFATKTELYQNLIMVVIGLASIAMAFIGGWFLSLAFIPYLFIGIFIRILHSRRGKTQRHLTENEVVVAKELVAEGAVN